MSAEDEAATTSSTTTTTDTTTTATTTVNTTVAPAAPQYEQWGIHHKDFQSSEDSQKETMHSWDNTSGINDTTVSHGTSNSTAAHWGYHTRQQPNGSITQDER